MMRALTPFALVALLVTAAVVAIAASPAGNSPVSPATTATVTITVPARYRGRTAAAWAARYRARTRQLQRADGRVWRLRREVLRRWDYPTLLAIAAAAYGIDDRTLDRKARCESVNFTDFYNETSGATNVMQFLPSTWSTTPYARFSIWNPFAAVLAGAWMHKVGRGGEWVCR